MSLLVKVITQKSSRSRIFIFSNSKVFLPFSCKICNLLMTWYLTIGVSSKKVNYIIKIEQMWWIQVLHYWLLTELLYFCTFFMWLLYSDMSHFHVCIGKQFDRHELTNTYLQLISWYLLVGKLCFGLINRQSKFNIFHFFRLFRSFKRSFWQ